MKYTIIIHQESDDDFWAEVEEIPGTFGAGNNLEEVAQSIIEALRVQLGIELELMDSSAEINRHHSDFLRIRELLDQYENKRDNPDVQKLVRAIRNIVG